MKTTRGPAEKTIYNYRHKKGAAGGAGRVNMRFSKTSTSRQVNHKQENTHNCGDSLPGESGLSRTSGFPTHRPTLGQMSPQNVWL